jgi:nucleoside 2-deoxyribosyltransferase
MSFSAQVFRVLIASPSDVEEEREIAVRTIQEWNDLNAAERQLVLLPLRWETHTTPEYGKRPQEVINRQIVDHCDLVVGIFWTRIGSPTGIADSGTIEEIERVASKGKPVMLYFSRAKQDPESIDLEQLSKLRQFKKATFPKALIETYGGVVEFKDKLSKQIELQLRTLLAERSEAGNDEQTQEARPITDIVLNFADLENGTPSGTNRNLKSQFFDVVNFNEIPDYVTKEENQPKNRSHNTDLLSLTATNKEYYRQRVTSLVIKEFFSPIKFSLQNLGGVGARDVYIDMHVTSNNGKISFVTKDQLPNTPPSVNTNSYLYGTGHPNSPDHLISRNGLGWSTSFEVAALQPQRQLSPGAVFYIGALDSCDISITAKIFADTLPKPVIQTLKIHLDVNTVQVDANELLDGIIRPEDNLQRKLDSNESALTENKKHRNH